MKNNKNEFKLGDIVKVLVNNKHRVRGEIVDIKDDIAVVVVPVYYSSCYEYIAVESKLNNLWEVKEVL